MLDWISKEFLVAVVAALIIALVAVSWGGPPGDYRPSGDQGTKNSQTNQSGSNQEPVPEMQCDRNCTAKNADKIGNPARFMRFFDKIVDDPLTSGILIANFLLVLAVLVQIRDSRVSSEARLRAYVVSVVGSQLRQGGVKGLKFEFRPIILNTGQTPAYEVRTVSRVRFMSIQESEGFDFRVTDPRSISQITLGQRQDRFIQTVLDGRLSKAELRQFRKSEKLFYVYGTTWYRDAFGRPRYTNHCYQIWWWSKRGGPPLWQTVTRHSDSN